MNNSNVLKNAVATYRLQLNKDFTLYDAAEVANYLQQLGVSHIYLSPVLESVSGSNHGYDVTDFTRVSTERGGEDALLALDRKARQLGLGMILDIVPNHMASSLENPFWCDVLALGKESAYWNFFDFRYGEDGKLHLPILGEALKPGAAQLRLGKKGAPVLVVDDHELPLSPRAVEELTNGARAAGQEIDYFAQHLPAAQLGDIVASQNYTLSVWTEATSQISYRRFFNIAELVGLRMEDPSVFTAAHRKLFELLRACPSIEGVRVDHIDGLLDPTAYLQQLAQTVPIVWVEKILAPGEAMRSVWPVRGTTGYEFGEKLHAIFVQDGGFILIEDYWRDKVENTWPDFPTCVFAGKTEVMEKFFQPELNRLAKLSGTPETFWTAIAQGLPVYRTYIVDKAPDATDRDFIHAAVKTTKKYKAWPATADGELNVLLNPRNPDQQRAAREWQQLSGAVMAKGLEDTAHYRYTPMTALNEVGCQPILADTAPEALLAWLGQRSREWPQALNATTTHDTKRNEDVRCRLLALTEMPGDWIAMFERLEKMLPPAETSALDRTTVYFVLQTIVGSWPFDDRIDDDYRARIHAYTEKAMREAKRRTGWNAPDQAYETAMAAAIDFYLTDAAAIDDLKRFMPPMTRCGALNALTAQAIKILSPGIPDLYQGTEMWNLSLVDPDNRRPVDYAARRALLEQWRAPVDNLPEKLTTFWRDGAIKLWLTQRLLAIRRDYLLPLGEIIEVKPVLISGERAKHLIAYKLIGAAAPDRGLLVVAPRFTNHLLDPQNDTLSLAAVDWHDTALDFAGGGENLLTGHKLSAAEGIMPEKLFENFPLAVLAF